MIMLNRPLMGKACRLAFQEARILVPLFVLFDFLLIVLPSVLLMSGAIVQTNGTAPAFHPRADLLILLIPLVAVLSNLMKVAAIRARSLHIPLNPEYFAGAVQRGFWPVMRVYWSIFWRSFLLSLLLAMVAGVVSAILGHAAPATPPVFPVKIGTGLIVSMLLLFMVVMAYALPFIFAAYFRQFHPRRLHRDAIDFGKAHVAGRRVEILITLLVLSLLLIVPIVINGAIGRPAPVGIGLGLVLGLLGILFNTACGLPVMIASYLYYEGFETAAGIAPDDHAAPNLPLNPL